MLKSRSRNGISRRASITRSHVWWSGVRLTRTSVTRAEWNPASSTRGDTFAP